MVLLYRKHELMATGSGCSVYQPWFLLLGVSKANELLVIKVDSLPLFQVKLLQRKVEKNMQFFITTQRIYLFA